MHLPPALKNQKFVFLWLGLMVSVAGSQMQVAAIHWHIRDLSGSPDPLALGGIGLARILPVIVFSLFGGAFADTYNRRVILFITQASMALTAVGLAALTFTGLVEIWHIYALTAIQAAAIAFDAPARQAIVPNIVDAKDLPNAFSLNSIAFNVGAVVGPVLSGVVIATLGRDTPTSSTRFPFWPLSSPCWPSGQSHRSSTIPAASACRRLWTASASSSRAKSFFRPW